MPRESNRSLWIALVLLTAMPGPSCKGPSVPDAIVADAKPAIGEELVIRQATAEELEEYKQRVRRWDWQTLTEASNPALWQDLQALGRDRDLEGDVHIVEQLGQRHLRVRFLAGRYSNGNGYGGGVVVTRTPEGWVILEEFGWAN